ncbi:SMP-30/gluconolactonase/LRE family protein [Flavisphingomonas formosensis]|uniref:SMP-30/gluconolactonase/LRE family protein n=1 Tax=Flavisphingomonas formosensis TaxID=861534 RepID=UPI0012FA5D39|nr:SMP-30/gluconolactonase/LRE family protein [Sphingomonas formosensis]
MERTPQSVLSLGAVLGEGPLWVERDRALWFVDIKGPLIHRYDPATAVLRSWPVPAPVGWIVPAVAGDFIVGLKTGLHRFDPATGRFALIHDPETHLPGNRLNDATVDRDGRIWFGSMDDVEVLMSGRIYRTDGGVSRDTGALPVTITNGPALSPDGTILYHVDTLGRTIWKSRIDAARLVETAPFARIEEGAGYPDGPTVDADGCLWIGLFGGWGVRRYDPSGTLMTHIAFRVANVTKVAFGGDGLATAYATTARKGLTGAMLHEQPQAGDLFAFDPGVSGLPGHYADL